MSKNAGYEVMFAATGSFYTPSTGRISLVTEDAYDWDVIAHEFGHAIAHETHSTDLNAAGGPHTGGNQYDENSNPDTYRNKERALSLAFNEGYGTWIGVTLLENSAYKGKMPNVGDGIYSDTEDTTYHLDMEANSSASLGEDTELAVAKLLWDIYDAASDANATATCQTNCRDSLAVGLRNMFQGSFKDRNNKNISKYYPNIYRYVTGMVVGEIETNAAVNTPEVDKTNALGASFAEFGIAPHIDEADNVEAFKHLDDAQNPPLLPTLTWRQHDTGTMPGLDQFEIVLFNETRNQKLYQFTPATQPSRANKNSPFQYTLTVAERDALVAALKQGHTQKVHTIVKGTASGAGAAGGAIATGPYYGNAATLEVPQFTKPAVIAVDSSGSNVDTDPDNLRISAAHAMLRAMGARNQEIAAGTAPNADELPTRVAAVDFDANAYLLASFAPAEELAARNVFNSIDSYGGTDVALAIDASAWLINPSGTVMAQSVFPNQAKIYLLTDMDNNYGLEPVIVSVNSAGAQRIAINIGHLVPLVSRRVPLQSKDGLRGEKATVRPKLAESMDPLVAALLDTGGSYAVIENAAAQNAWVTLMGLLNNTNPATRTEVELPLDVKLYGLAVANDGRSEPTYVFHPNTAQTVTVTVDGKSNFVPALHVNGTGSQTPIGQDMYELSFAAHAGQTYRIELNEAPGDAGLYSIVLRGTALAAVNPAEPIPVNNAWMLALAALLLMLLAARQMGVAKRSR